MASKTGSQQPFISPGSALLPALLLALVLGLLFFRSLLPNQIHFSNDGPLGAISVANRSLPEMFSGSWQDTNSLGSNGGIAVPSFTYLLQWLLGPVVFSKVYAPLAIFLLGLCAWFCFRQWGLAPAACVLGGLAAAFNSTFFSVACWGIAGHTVNYAMTFLAMGLLAQGQGVVRWIRAALAGVAVGLAVMDGGDMGALFSMFVAATIAWQAVTEESVSRVRSVVSAIGRLALVAGFAGFVATASVYTLVQTSIVGIAGTQQDTRTKAERWDFATQWSTPKIETLQVVASGLFGYRMDTPEGGNYWGAVGRDPAWDRYFASGGTGPQPPGSMRFTGGGNYAGVLVVLLAAWTVAQAMRRKDSVFTPQNRRWIEFWTVVVLVAVPLAWGRFAPFYQVLYALPYFSTIRNPAKFMSFASMGLVVLFTFGVHGLVRSYLGATAPFYQAGSWWKRLREFDRRWAIGGFVAVGLAAISFLIYTSSRQQFVAYLNTVQLGGDIAETIASFSFKEAGLAVVLLALGLALVLAVLSGAFSGSRGRAGIVVLGVFLALDLLRANLPWVIYWDWPYKYATNPVIEFLKQKPYEQRVAGLPFPVPQQFALLGDVYRIEWAQHHFLQQNIQSLDMVQMPRMPEDLMAFENVWRTNGTPGLLRRWELSNTRYLLGPAAFAEGLNVQVDPEKKRFSVKLPFDIKPKPGAQRVAKLEDFNAVPSPEGPYAVIEFSGALPRAKLYSRWSVNTNSAEVLKRLFEPSFDPQQEVIVTEPIALPATAATTNAPGTVEFVSYAPKDIVLKASVKAPAVLLLNDRYDPGWSVRVNDKAAPLLHANFLMRGVRLEPGEHVVRFQFRAPLQPLYVSIAGLVVAVVLVGALVALNLRQRRAVTAPEPQSPSPRTGKAAGAEASKGTKN